MPFTFTVTFTMFLLACIVLLISVLIKLLNRPDPGYWAIVAGVLALLALHGG